MTTHFHLRPPVQEMVFQLFGRPLHLRFNPLPENVQYKLTKGIDVLIVKNLAASCEAAIQNNSHGNGGLCNGV